MAGDEFGKKSQKEPMDFDISLPMDEKKALSIYGGNLKIFLTMVE